MTKKTVFVIGAGASKEANLPTGTELKDTIAGLLDIDFDSFGRRPIKGDSKIVEALRLHAKENDENNADISPYIREAMHIRDALPQAISIDNFIDAHKGNEKMALCGKLGIVRAILGAEGRSLLYFERHRQDSTFDFSKLSGTWYMPFFQQLTENCGKDDLFERFQNITLIIFNYDRCVEHFIYNALKNYYRVPDEAAAELVKVLNIFHPYGVVGILPWQYMNGGVEFGHDANYRQLLEIANTIKTFTEGTDPDSSEIFQIRNHMSELDRLVFVGFAFHKLNMQLITPEKTSYGSTECYATAHNISNSDWEVIEEDINRLYKGHINIKMSTSKCGIFFNEFWRSLSF